MNKSELIRNAYAQIRISGLTVEPTPEDNTAALYELDQMMWEWRGVRREVGYNFPEPTSGGELVISDPGDSLGVHDYAIAGTMTSLAIRLVDYFGKEVPQGLYRKLKGAMRPIQQNALSFTEIPYPNRMPRGRGNTYRVPQVRRFYKPSYVDRSVEKPIQTQQVIDCQQDFTRTLKDGDEIASYTIAPDPYSGIKVLSHSRDGNVVSYRVQAPEQNRDGHVDIKIKTVSGVTDTARECFDVEPVSCPTVAGNG